MDEDFGFTSGGLRFAGTLTLPAGDKPAAALLLVGSGKVDRDSNAKQLSTDITKQLAEALAAAGVASLRYDKRGVGASEGDFFETSLSDNTADATAALAALRADPRIDPARLVVIGHSEGALHALRLAVAEQPPAAAVLISPPAKSGDELLEWQADRLAGSLSGWQQTILRLLRTDLPTMVRKSRAKIVGSTAPVVRVMGQKVNVRWYRELLESDPRTELALVRIPLLAICGSKDLQVDPADLDTIAALVPDGRAQTLLVPDLSHLLRVEPGEPRTSNYRNQVREPVDPAVVAAVVSFVTGLA